jgi:hypothetical protein
MGVIGKRNKDKKPIKKKREYNNDSHKELIEIVAKWLKKHTNNAQIPNCPYIAKDLMTNTDNGEIPDVIGWNYWTSVLIEVKVSRQDFLKDQNKKFRYMPELGMGEFRYYCCPEGLIKEEELPEGWGLLYLNDKNKIDTIKIADRKESNLMCERTMLLSLIRRNKIAL